MHNLITLIVLILFSTNLSAEVLKDEVISGAWGGIMIKDDVTGAEACGVRTMIMHSGGNTSVIFLSTHGMGITNNGSKRRYDFAVGPSKDSTIQVSDKEPHQIREHLIGDRERLIREFKSGDKAKIAWHDYIQDERSIISLAGFTKAYDTSKEWCDWGEKVASDEISPVVTLVGKETVDIELGSSYIDAGVTGSDNLEGDISDRVTTIDTVKTNIVGSYSITYHLSDTAGNTAIPQVRKVNVTEDKTAPEIILTGSSNVIVELGNSYVDNGATGSDNIDGDISGSITVIDNVNTDAVGSYSVDYNLSDAAGNTATPVARSVNVVKDATPPKISLLGYISVGIELGSIYFDSGAVGSDNIDGDISDRIVTTSEVNTSVVGSYSVSYNLSDAAGNTATSLIRNVNVIADTTPPQITLIGYSTVGIELGSNYKDPGAIGSDNIDGDISSNILSTSDVNPQAVGSYSVKYQLNDAAGNSAIPVARKVIVSADITPPKITLLGYKSVSIELGSNYEDAGATSYDNFDGDIIDRIKFSSNLNTELVGSYSITYNVEDSAGNAAVAIVRNVNVTQ